MGLEVLEGVLHHRLNTSGSSDVARAHVDHMRLLIMQVKCREGEERTEDCIAHAGCQGIVLGEPNHELK